MKPSKESVKKFLTLIPANTPEEELEDPWLDGLNFSQAFVVCVGAGPWKAPRREQVQAQALKRLGDKDLSELLIWSFLIPWYPLNWQNKMLDKIIKHLLDIQITFEAYCIWLKKIADGQYSKARFASDMGYSKLPKVLSLFVRDKLKLPSFPLDRHVKRVLDDFEIPHDEEFIVQLCKKAGVNPSQLNRWIFKQKSSNPDWRKKLIDILI